MIHLWARLSRYCPLRGLTLNSYQEPSSAKENQLASTHHSFLLDQLLSFLSVGVDTWHRAFSHAFARSSLADDIIHWGRRPWSKSQSVLALWACRTKKHKRAKQKAAVPASGQLCTELEVQMPTPAFVRKHPLHPAHQVPQSLVPRARQLTPDSSHENATHNQIRRHHLK